eukprot:1149775-Pelagomonas_calceolata.AAC.6
MQDSLMGLILHIPVRCTYCTRLKNLTKQRTADRCTQAMVLGCTASQLHSVDTFIHPGHFLFGAQTRAQARNAQVLCMQFHLKCASAMVENMRKCDAQKEA